MATTHTEARLKPTLGKSTRRNEIIAIALVALSTLLLLCLLSYNPNDASWNAAGQTGKTQNLVGHIGANTAAALYQAVGLAALLVPLLLLAAAWRCFHARKLRAPSSRSAGLLLITLAASALLALSNLDPLFDHSVQPGGLLGTLVAQALASGLNRVGASVLLLAVFATGVLLATNISFVHLYQRGAGMVARRLAFIQNLPERFRAWQVKRHEEGQARLQRRRAAQAEQAKAQAMQQRLEGKSGAERVAEFMRGSVANNEAETSAAVTTTVNRSTSASSLKQALQINSPEAAGYSAQPPIVTVVKGHDEAPNEDVDQEFDENEQAPVSLKRLPAEQEVAEVEQMVRTATVVRTEVEQETSTAANSASNRKASAVKRQQLDYRMPSIEFLNAPQPRSEQDDAELLGLATLLAEKLREFNVTGQIKHICPGPVVTTYEFKPDAGVKYSRVTNLVDDLCLALKAESIRIDRLPGKPHVGIEVPNPNRETIYLREVIESRQFRESTSKLTIALGKTIDGLNYVADLAKMPHLLIAGATGTGKSVCLNSLVVSILYKATPDEVKFIMVDPKRLELGLYADIPHLATPIITEPKRAANALKWAVAQMEQRYKDLASWGVRNIDGFNAEVARRNKDEDFDEVGEPWKPLPYLVIIIDELADLMMVSGHEVEESITRLAQMARAVGIHLVLATQRPSVDVITGLIKANFPSRISCRVSSKVDSRTIIDTNGAEQLLGRGDMLFLPPGTSRLIRVHGAYLDETETTRIVESIKAQAAPSYDLSVTQSEEEAMGADGSSGDGAQDELFEDALRICVEMKRASTSVLQRRLRIGYGRAAAILDHMEREGYIGQADGARPRPVLGKAFEMVAHWDEMEAEEPS